MSASEFSMGGSMTASFGGQPGSQPSGSAGDHLIKDSSTASFGEDVIEASKSVPVIVDFWAPWCGPCKQLTPVLEKAVQAAGGKVRLVKINVDENQALAGQLRIQSIPAVFAFVNGQPADGFMGALPESQINEFIGRIIAAGGGTNPGIAEFIDAARTEMQAGNIEQAMALLAEVIRQENDNVSAIALLAKCQIELGDADAASATLELIPNDKIDDPDVTSARAALELTASTTSDSELRRLADTVEANPGDHQTRYDYALALNAAGDSEGAIDQLISIVKADREWNEDAARKQLLTFFEAWGPADKRSIGGRRKLSTVLFS